MPDIALRPRSPTELVDAAFQLYRRDPLPLITGAAVIMVPWNLFLVTSGVLTRFANVEPTANGLPADALAQLLPFSVGIWLVYLLTTNVTALLANEVYFGRRADLKKALIGSLVTLPTIIIAALITGFLGTIGLVFLIIPGLYLFARFFAARPAILMENVGVGRSIARSWSLSKGQVRHVINTMGLALLLNYAITAGSGFFALIIPSVVVRQLITMIAACVSYPMVGIVMTVLYYDVRIRREGFDIEYLAMAAPVATEVSTAP